jgi:hypothetical protein
MHDSKRIWRQIGHSMETTLQQGDCERLGPVTRKVRRVTEK